MISEYEISKLHNNTIIPVGCTGYVAEQIWKELYQDLSNYFPQADDNFRHLFQQLNIKNDYKEVTKNILEVLKLCNKQY